MRVLCVMVLLMCCGVNLKAEELKKGDVIKLNTRVEVQNIVHSVDGDTQKFPEYLGEYLYKISNIGEEFVELVPINFTDNEKNTIKTSNDSIIYLKDLYNNRILTVKKADLLGSYSKSEPIERVSFGALSLPFKFRPQDNYAYEDKININTTINFNFWNYGNSSWGLQLGTGFGSVELNEDNAFGNFDSTKTSSPCLSLLTGVLYNYDYIQFGAYIGVDYINNQSDINWKHNGNLWVGFGIGFKIFNVSLMDEEKDN